MLRPATVLLNTWAAPLAVLNKLWAVIAVVWLFISNKWDFLAYGITYDFIGTLLLPVALIPTLLLLPLSSMLPNHRSSSVGLGILGIVYTNTLVTLSCANVFYFFLSRTPEALFWPSLLWAYGTATLPWNVMAGRDHGNPSAELTLRGVQSGCVILALALVFFRLDWRGTIGVMADYMTLWSVLQLAFLFAGLGKEPSTRKPMPDLTRVA